MSKPKIASEQHAKIQHANGLAALVNDLIQRMAALEAAQPPPAPPTSSLIREKEAAQYLGVRVPTLANWRHYGKGPNYRKVGRSCLYSHDDLDAWLDAQTVIPSPKTPKSNRHHQTMRT
jgi:excisionase family DNA binding protein